MWSNVITLTINHNSVTIIVVYNYNFDFLNMIAVICWYKLGFKYIKGISRVTVQILSEYTGHGKSYTFNLINELRTFSIVKFSC